MAGLLESQANTDQIIRQLDASITKIERGLAELAPLVDQHLKNLQKRVAELEAEKVEWRKIYLKNRSAGTP